MNISKNKQFLWILIPFTIFLTIAMIVFSFSQVTNNDIEIIKFIQNTFTFISVEGADKLSHFHGKFLNFILFFACLFLISKKDYKLTLLFFICNYTSYGTVEFIKDIIKRHRPPFELQPLHHPENFSFPSGHSFEIVILLGLLCYIFYKYIPNKIIKNTFFIVCVIMIILVGLSRIILGVHYPTDVLAGFMLGITFVSLVIMIDKN